MASPFPSVIFNAREEALSSDIDRGQTLKSQAMQNELLYEQLDSAGAAVNCFTKAPTLAGIAATFQVTYGAGEAMVFDATGVGADDSAYKVMQWATQNIVFANPDGVNPRIDLVVMTPANVNGDLSTRNVLQDPTTRAFAPASLPKTQRPTCVPVVVTGVAGATPSPPAIPAGAFALHEVYVPAAVADATSFLFVPRLFRKAGYPWLGGSLEVPQNGVVRGCLLTYAGTFEAIAQPSLGGLLENQVVIDGELISFAALSNSGLSDALANPFGVAAPGGNDVPYYIYVCGGRGLPQNSGAYPAILISSLTAPDPRSGRPTSPIRTPRGDTSSAVYVGIGFVLKGTTNHQICKTVGDRVWWASTTGTDPQFETQAVAAGATNLSFPSAPAVSDEVELLISAISGAGVISLRETAMPASNPIWQRNYGGALAFDGTVRIPINASAGGPHLGRTTTPATVNLSPVAYNTKVRRLA